MDDSCFVTHPHEVSLINMESDKWLNDLRKQVQKVYSPESANVVNCPKKGWHLRPGAVLSLRDHVVYNALIIDIIGKIRKRTQWSVRDRIEV